MNIQGYSYYREVRLGHWFLLAPLGLGNGPHVLGNGPHVLGKLGLILALNS